MIVKIDKVMETRETSETQPSGYQSVLFWQLRAPDRFIHYTKSCRWLLQWSSDNLRP